MSKSVSATKLERLFQLLHETKKEVHYNKHEGNWSWSDKGDNELENWVHGFPTALEAMKDAVSPYL